MKKLLFLLLLLPAPASAQTRFYLGNTGTGTVGATNSPAADFTAWSDTTTSNPEGGPYHYGMHTAPQGSAMITDGLENLDAGTTDSCLVAIFVSEPISAQTISGTVKGQVRCQEDNSANGATLALALAVVSNNCDTLRGILLNTSASDGTATPPEFVVAPTTATNRQFQNSSESASPTLSSVDAMEGDRIVAYVGFRETRNSTTATATLVFGDDNASDLPEDNTTTTANNPWLEFSNTISFPTNQPSQPPVGCQTMPGDTLYPWIDGDSIGLSATGTPHADFLDEAPNSAGCGSANDSVWISGNTNNRDFFRLRTLRNDSTWGTFRGSRANDQIDCIAISACARRQNTFGAARDGYVQLGIMDSTGGTRKYFTGPAWIMERNTSRQVFTWYIPNRPAGNEEFSESRWDSASLANLQVRVRLRTTNNADTLALFNVYVLVFASSRDTTIMDSVNSANHALACTSSVELNLHRQMGLFNSDLNKEKFWGAALSAATTNEWLMFASQDTGKTWLWLDDAASGDNSDDFTAGLPDTITIRASNELIGAAGIAIFGDTSYNAADSFFVAGQRPGGLDTLRIYKTKRNQQIRADFLADSAAPGVNDDCVLVWPVLFSKGDTLWRFGASAATSARPMWQVSYNRGASWSDTGYIQGDGEAYTSAGTEGISTTSGVRRIAVVRWTDGYPAVFVTGYTSAGDGGKIVFRKWHPSIWSGGGTVAESLRHHAFWRNNSTTTVDSLTVWDGSTQVANSGEMAATSIYNGGSPIAHVVFLHGSQVRHRAVHSDFTLDSTRVFERSKNRLGNDLFYLSMTSVDTFVYVFYNYHKTSTTGAESSTDTQYIFYQLYCGGGWRGPRLFAYSRRTSADSVHVRYRFPSAPQYQYGTSVVAVYNRSVRSGANVSVAANRIVRTGYFGAAGGAQPPLRRRRLIIEKNHRMGENDEKDSLGIGGLVLHSRPYTEE